MMILVLLYYCYYDTIVDDNKLYCKIEDGVEGRVVMRGLKLLG